MMNKYIIDYDFGMAILYTPVEEPLVISHFQYLANQCFEIRKSAGYIKLLQVSTEEMPKPWILLKDATHMLAHNGDVIIWDSKGNKINSEYD